MLISVPFVMALTMQQAPSQPTQAAPSPVARIIISPAVRTVAAGDTLRLSAQAYDVAGRKIDATIRFGPFGGEQEADVYPDGLVVGGAPGTIPAGVMALVPGTRPIIERFDIRVVPAPAATVDIPHAPSKVLVGQRLTLRAHSYSATGYPRADTVRWTSTNPAIARVQSNGVLTGRAPGRVTITATVPSSRSASGRDSVSHSFKVEVIDVRLGSLEMSRTTPTVRQGDVVRFELAARSTAGASVTGLSAMWGMSGGAGLIDQDGAFVAYDPGDYVVSAVVGAQSVERLVHVVPRGVRRPISVVGRLPRSEFNTEELWLHPNGKVAYLGTGAGGDRLYVIDITDPAKPRLTDSIVANTRRVNDVMTTPDGKTLVFTREGASDRRDGIVIADATDPAHPRPIAEFTQGVEGGVHSAFIARQEKYGTHVYLTNDATGALHILDISDPHKPREVSQWRVSRRDLGLTLHDVDVRDGLAYLSYWNEGLIILDVGNGIRGGTPSKPVLVSRLKYDFDEIYRDVIASSGSGYQRGTHTAWRHGNYIFLADEVWPASGVKGASGVAAGRAYGRLHVVDATDIERLRIVAWYEPEYGGAHYFDIAGDTLYLGAYNGGFRAFDISGELRGDLRAQGREIAHLHTADAEGKVPNHAMTWGAIYRDGLVYVNDMHNGLWIVRIDPRPPAQP